MKDLGIKKLYYSISEVGKITGLEQYVLRYWESEFDDLKPSKNRAGNRIYTNKDIQVILKIKKLLKEEKYTIDGAKKILQEIESKEESSDEEQIEFFPLQKLTVPAKEKKPDIVNPDIRKDLEDVLSFLVYLKSKL
jgi:DNA-binding transcriptional MerR regulator